MTTQSSRHQRLAQNSTHVNPLVAGAATLLSLLPKFSNTPTHSGLAALQRQLQGELKAFGDRAQGQGYRPITILLATTLLATTVDDTLCHTPWGKSQWPLFSLASWFQTTHEKPPALDNLIQRLEEDVPVNVDLLELIYLCLRLSPVAPDTLSPGEKRSREILMDDIFRATQWQRGDNPRTLNDLTSLPPVTPLPKPKLLRTLALTLVLMLTTVGSLHLMLDVSSAPLKHQLKNLTIQ